jgi:hypothetical protein
VQRDDVQRVDLRGHAARNGAGGAVTATTAWLPRSYAAIGRSATRSRQAAAVGSAETCVTRESSAAIASWKACMLSRTERDSGRP